MRSQQEVVHTEGGLPVFAGNVWRMVRLIITEPTRDWIEVMSEDWKQYLQQAIDSSADSGYAESWRPEEGETIVGEVVAMETVDTRYGASEVMTLRTEDGDIAVWLTSVLKDLVATNHVGEGSKLAVRYDGKVTNKAGTSEYKTFTLQLYQETEVVGAEQPF